MLDLDLDVIGLTIRLLCSPKLATRLKERRCHTRYQLIRYNVSGYMSLHVEVVRTLFLLRG